MANQRIFALFQDVLDAERAIGALEDHGIPREAIGVASRRPAEQPEAGRVQDSYVRLSDQEGAAEGEPQAAYVPAPGALPPAALAQTVTPESRVDTPANVEAVGKDGITTTTPQDAAVGASYGGAVGLVGGLLLAAAAITIPGFGLILGGGALAAAFGAAVGTTAAGAVAGGVVGYLRDMGMPEQAAASFADRIHEGDYLLTVNADSDRYDELKQLLLKYNAAGVDVNVAQAGDTLLAAPPPVLPPAVTMPVVAPVETMPVDTTPIVVSAPLIAPVPPVMVVPSAMPVLAETPAVPAPFAAPPPEVYAPEPTTRLVTEAADGTPLIPAQTVVVTPARPVGETPDEEAARMERAREMGRETRT